jgi:hypothetical protein
MVGFNRLKLKQYKPYLEILWIRVLNYFPYESRDLVPSFPVSSEQYIQAGDQ